MKMLEIYEGLNTLDLLSHYALWHNQTLVYFVNKNFKSLDENKQQEILSFYEEFLPDDILQKIIADNDHTVVFSTLDSAMVNAASWFPAIDYLPDADYYWHTYVIGPDGDFEYENTVYKPKPEEPAEGA
jgi:hypothetical protein